MEQRIPKINNLEPLGMDEPLPFPIRPLHRARRTLHNYNLPDPGRKSHTSQIARC